MKTQNSKQLIYLLSFFIILIFGLYVSGCSDNSSVNNPTQSVTNDNDYLKSVVSSGYDNNQVNEDNLMSQVVNDLNTGPVNNDQAFPGLPIDSLKKWGRRISNVNVNYSITDYGDTMKALNITRTINGNYIIIGTKNGVTDSVNKPYTEVFFNNVKFKRIERETNPRMNWRLYQISMLNGGTTQPQVGSSQVMITKIELYQDNFSMPRYTFNGPDFQNKNIFTTMKFGGTGIPQIDREDSVYIKVYTTSQLAPVDIVAWHWPLNTFGFHRVQFDLLSQTGGGPYERVYAKSIKVFHLHRLGSFNGDISASTHESLWDDDINKFASSEVGFPYRVTR